jgi:AraC-like DNA-binding protein
MLSQALLAPPALFQLSPPYENLEAAPDTFAPENLPLATLLMIGLTSPEESWGELSALVPRLRERCPALPVVLRMGHPAEPGEADWERRAAELHLRAVVYEGEPLPRRLRRVLTQPGDLAGELTEWLPLRLPGLPPAIVALVGTIVERAASFAEVGALLASIDRAERTVRTWFGRAGIPGPGKWLALAHALRATRRLQSEDRVPLLALAVECGYSDHSSLSRQSLRLFGLRPGAIRPTLGWEWLVDRWLGRAGERAVRRAGEQAAEQGEVRGERWQVSGETSG